jgi:hypothetical protein
MLANNLMLRALENADMDSLNERVETSKLHKTIIFEDRSLSFINRVATHNPKKLDTIDL